MCEVERRFFLSLRGTLPLSSVPESDGGQSFQTQGASKRSKAESAPLMTSAVLFQNHDENHPSLRIYLNVRYLRPLN